MLRIIWPFIVIVLFQALLASVSLYTMSAVRSYVAGESQWSKGLKDATYELTLYIDSPDPLVYLAYQHAIEIPQGGHLLRMALEQPTPDREAARVAFLQGGNHPDDVDGIIWLFLNFHHFNYLERAIAQWTIGDSYVTQLDLIAQEVHRNILAGSATAADKQRWKEQIQAVNAGVSPAANAFSDDLGEGSRAILRLLLFTNLATSLCLIGLALLRTYWLLSQRRAFANALQSEKERAETTLASIGDAVITTDVNGVITYLNPAAERLTQWKAPLPVGMSIVYLFQLIDENAPSPENAQQLIDDIFNGRLVSGIEHPRRVQRLDGSSVAVNLVASPILSDGMASGMVLVLHDMTREHEYIANLSWQASHDALTGLANRREFELRLEQALSDPDNPPGSHVLMFLDLDQFKLVNDTCGHAAGDELLQHIGRVLQSGLRERDVLARLGGDEFGVLLMNCRADAVERIAENLRARVQNLHFVWQGRAFLTTVSIGVARLAPTSGDEPCTLETSLRAADMACYLAKEKGRNRVQVYHSEDSELSTRYAEMAWVQRLRLAIDENRFCLYAQDIVALDSAGAGHIEILLRLHDENGELVLPHSFIPAAERFGLMSTLDRWVVNKVFGEIAECQRAGHHGPLATCAINLSGASVGDDGFLEFLRGQFALHGIAPQLICLEITETTAIANLADASRFINELKSLGCQFSLDDFGAGMSSFGYLKHLPVDYLKIDGSFVKDMLDDPVNCAMVEAINHIGHVMGKKTIAEFVESPAIHQALIEVGVDYAQGYAIGRPAPFTCERLHGVVQVPVQALR